MKRGPLSPNQFPAKKLKSDKAHPDFTGWLDQEINEDGSYTYADRAEYVGIASHKLHGLCKALSLGNIEAFNGLENIADKRLLPWNNQTPEGSAFTLLMHSLSRHNLPPISDDLLQKIIQHNKLDWNIPDAQGATPLYWFMYSLAQGRKTTQSLL